jgi:ABC-2 type transport system permease protein
MSALGAILRRELLATFATPIGYVTIALVATLLGAVFVITTLRTGEPATLRAVLLAAAWTLLAASPAIAMRSFAEEFRQGTWETLLAAPIRPWQAVVAKFLAGTLLLALMIGGPVLACGLTLELYADPDWGEILCGAVGLLLAGAAFLAIGILASSLTSNQLVAFLLPVFFLFAIALGGRALAASLPAEWAGLAFGLDPLKRVEDFVLGLVDTANIVYFLSLTAAALAVASMSFGSVRQGGFGGGARTLLGRLGLRTNAFLFACGAFVAALAVAALAARPALRTEFDATKTRAYSLAPSTEAFLASLEGPWRIALLVSEERADPGSLRRVDEVLDRMQAIAPSLVAERIDPDGADSGAAYEALLESLTASQQSVIDQWMPVIEQGLRGYEDLRAFARAELPPLRAALAAMDQADPLREQVARIAAGLAQLTEIEAQAALGSDGASQGFAAAVRALLTTAADRPLPDWDGARSALAANNRLWSDQLSTTAALFSQWGRTASVAPALVRYALEAEPRFETQATSRRAEQYALEELPPLDLGDIGRVIGQGEAAVVLGPAGAVAIPSWQIVPQAVEQAGRATLGFDFGARAEQVLVGAMRSLTVARMPMVIFVHAEERSMLTPAQDRNDLSALVDALRTARYVVREWSVLSGDRPAPPKGQQAVWVIVPPLKREGLQTSDREKKLLDATRQLIALSEPTLVTFARNLLPLFGSRDPWEGIAAQLGLVVSTGKVLLELVPLSETTGEVQPWQPVERANRWHPIGAALDGQAAVFNHPTPIAFLDPSPKGTVGRTIIASVEPSPNRWIEDDWRETARPTTAVPSEKRFTEAQPIVVAIEEPDAGTGRVRRAVAVGSGGWMLSSVADVTQSLGGNRFALASPGNRELMLASVAWLSGEAALIEGTAGTSGREVARVGALGDRERGLWLAGLALGMPGLVTLTGVLVWWRRRQDHGAGPRRPARAG